MDQNQIAQMMMKKKGTHPFPEHLQWTRQIAADGIVLLKNEKNVLPLSVEQKIALFGAGAVDTVTCGTGSGYVSAPYVISIREGLEKAGMTITSNAWLDRFAAAKQKANDEDTTLSPIARMWSGVSILIDETEVTPEDIAAAREAQTAVYAIRRNAGEGGDRRNVKGDYCLSDTERKNLVLIAASFSRTVVLFNTCVMDAGFLEEIPGIDAALLVSMGGGETGNAVADVLTGKVSPSGRLTDTWARQYADYPASGTFSANDGDILQEDYTEDIFVGYRYFDTFGIEPLYPFGFGLSYTAFSCTVREAAADWETVRLAVRVTNTGSAAGREVVQVYVSAPEGRLTKPYQELKGYAKTGLLQPGQSENVQILIPTESLSSFDEASCTWVCEPGEYVFRIGRSSRDTQADVVLRLDREAALRRVFDVLRPDRPLNVLKAPARKPETINPAITLQLKASDAVLKDDTKNIPYSAYLRNAHQAAAVQPHLFRNQDLPAGP